MKNPMKVFTPSIARLLSNLLLLAHVKVARLQAGGGSPSSVDVEGSDGKNRTLTSKFSMRLKKVGDWVKYKTETGQNFYYNEKNGEFQWENPQEFYVGPEGDGGGTGQLKKEESGVWKVYKDPETGNIFWYLPVYLLYHDRTHSLNCLLTYSGITK